jgi:proline dehydrogenase
MPILRSALISLSKNRVLRHFCERSRLGSRLSSRFVAGVEMDDALRVAEFLNKQGIAVTLDSLGESVTSEAEAREAAAIYHRLLDDIAERKLNANLSVKLTQMGLMFSPELAEDLVEGLVEHARATGNFVRIDMEDSTLTQITLEMVRRLHARPELSGSIGTVIQASLYRSRADVEQLLAEGIRIRLCKGAYLEPSSVAFARKNEVDENYIRLSCILLESPIYHGLATHDEAMIAAAKSYAAQHGIEPGRFEFQMLYGIRRSLHRRLVREGYNMRVYVPFGRAWYPYFIRRLAERPANLLFIARNFFRFY